MLCTECNKQIRSLKIWGCTGFDIQLKLKAHVEVDRTASQKFDQKLNAEDNTSDILAEAEYIFNNADEFLAGVEGEMLLAA